MSKKLDLRSLDTSNPGSWPFAVKIAACVFAGLFIVGLAWYFFVADRRTELQTLEAQEVTLRAEFENLQGRAANLEPLKQQLAQMELMLQQMLRQLPSKNEMPTSSLSLSDRTCHGISNEAVPPGRKRLSFLRESRSTCVWSGLPPVRNFPAGGFGCLAGDMTCTTAPDPRATTPPAVLQGHIKTIALSIIRDRGRTCPGGGREQVMTSLSSRSARMSLAAIAFCFALSACTSDTKGVEAGVAEVKARPAPPLDPLPVMKQFETFEYSSEGLRDPFAEPAADRDSGSGLRPDPNRARKPSKHVRRRRTNVAPSGGGNLIGLCLPGRVTTGRQDTWTEDARPLRFTRRTRWSNCTRRAVWRLDGKPRLPLKTMIDWGIAR